MRELPETGPLLLPTIFDMLAPAIRGLITSTFRLILLGLVLLLPLWWFSSSVTSKRPARGDALPKPAATSALEPLNGTDQDGAHPTAGADAND